MQLGQQVFCRIARFHRTLNRQDSCCCGPAAVIDRYKLHLRIIGVLSHEVAQVLRRVPIHTRVRLETDHPALIHGSRKHPTRKSLHGIALDECYAHLVAGSPRSVDLPDARFLATQVAVVNKLGVCGQP